MPSCAVASDLAGPRPSDHLGRLPSCGVHPPTSMRPTSEPRRALSRMSAGRGGRCTRADGRTRAGCLHRRCPSIRSSRWTRLPRPRHRSTSAPERSSTSSVRAGSSTIPKERAIRERFGFSAARYHQLLNRVLEQPEALAYDPMLVRRLHRVRDARRRRRVARSARASAL